ncbi:MAG: glycosyltransferase family 2 protein [Chloroflexi bacterium]|nr:glycosyltransferase family 2 protein [Chloroflexota bacterium]
MSAPISIVILNYNTRDLLAACLHSIERFAPDAETIVVDNASPDDSAARVRAQFPGARLIANPDNRGFARGMNQGLRATTARFIFALNADTELTPTTLAPLRDACAQYPRAGIIAPAQVTPTGAHLASAFSDPTLAREAARLLLFSDALAARFKRGVWRAPIGAPRRVDWLMGAALFFRRECLDAVAGFAEAEFMYGEDWDVCYRARQLGWQIFLVPEAKIIHHENAAGKQMFQAHRLARVLEANLYFHEKHFGRASRRARAFIHLLGVGLRLIVAPRARRAQIELARVAWQGLR